MTDASQRIGKILDGLKIELPSWGFANTGTRFGKFVQAGAANSIEEKLDDAAEVNRLTGCCPRVAVHVAWDFPRGLEDAENIGKAARERGLAIGSINPTLFEAQQYKYGSLGNPDPAVRAAALAHIRESVEIMHRVGSSDLVLWFADGSNYPGTQSIRRRKAWFEAAFAEIAGWLKGPDRMLIEYKPFEPAFYHTDIADWGMAFLFARKAGPAARVLVDTGHHYHTQNIEQIVAWLLSEGMLGGFHFNDRKYADDDLTVGSIDPYQLFRVFVEILSYQHENLSEVKFGYMIDQSHNLKGKVEAMLQTVNTVQETIAKAALVDFGTLSELQDACRLVEAEECLRDAFRCDVRPWIESWRQSRDLPACPLRAFRRSDYLARKEMERGARNLPPGSAYV